jgi:hypothetical protein
MLGRGKTNEETASAKKHIRCTNEAERLQKWILLVQRNRWPVAGRNRSKTLQRNVRAIKKENEENLKEEQ